MNLKQFARSHLLEGVRINSMLTYRGDGWSESILFRDGHWQISLVNLQPNVQVKEHRHPHVESVDMLLSGGGKAKVGNLEILDGEAGKRLLRVPEGAWHEGNSGPEGAIYLSFQRWSKEPTFVSQDWEER